ARGPARPLPHEDVGRLPGPRLHRRDPVGGRGQGPQQGPAADHHDQGGHRDGRPGHHGAHRPGRARVREPARRGDPQRTGGPHRRLGAWRARARALRQGLGRGARPQLRAARRHQGAGPAGLGPPFRARPRGRVRRRAVRRHPGPHPQRRRGAAGACLGMTATGVPGTGYGKRQEKPTGLGGVVAAGRAQLLRGRRGWVTLTAAARTRAAAVGRVLDPVRSTFSTFGIAVTLTAVAAWVAGLMLGWLEVLVAAIVLTVTLVCAIVFVLGRFKYEVVLDLAQARVTVGDRAVGRLDVRNASSRPLLPSVMELPVGSGTAAFPVPRLPGGGSHEEIFTIPTRRRRVITVGPVKSVRADPLGLLRREMTWTGEQEVFVHPRVKNLTGSSTGFLKDLEGRVTNDITNSDVNFHALRDYVPGDDRRHIHWKTTARTGQLMVRQFE